jgi:hypothetical protein
MATEVNFGRTAVFSPGLSTKTEVSLKTIESKISRLEAEAAYQMALETFLDCSNVKVLKMAKPRPSEKLINRWSAQ